MNSSNYWARYRAKVGRRKFLAATGAGIGSAAFLAACGGDDDSGTSGTGTTGSGTGATGGGTGTTGAGGANGLISQPVDTHSTAKKGGVIKTHLNGEPSTLDPMPFDTPLYNNIKNSVYSMLIREKPGYLKPQDYKELEPNIAESWEYSPDHLTLTMKIRQDAVFHDKPPVNGRPMDIEDVVASWERYAEVGNYRFTVSNASNPAAPIESFEAIDKSTLRINLAKPAANLLNLLAHPFHGRYVVMPKETGDSFDPKGDMIGTGPWVLNEYVSGSGMKFKRHAKYWDDKGRPYADEVEDPFMNDYPARLAQFQAGNLYTAAMSNEDALVMKSAVPQVNLFAVQPFSMHTSAERFGFLPAGSAPFGDQRARQAFSMALDRDLYISSFGAVDKMEEAGVPVTTQWAGPVVDGNFFWLDPKGSDFGTNAKYYQHNLAEAKALLSAAGFPDGLEVPAHRVAGGEYGPQYHPQSDVIEQMVGDAGIRSNPDPQDFTKVYVLDWLQGNGKYDGYVHTRAPLTGNDPVTWFSDLYWSKGGDFFLGSDAAGKGDASGDPEIDALIEKLRVEFDVDAQQEMAYDLQRTLAERMYTVLMPGRSTLLFVAWPVLGNFLTEQGVYGYAGSENHDIFNWWIDDSQAPLA